MKKVLAAMTAALMMVALVSSAAVAAKPTFHNSNLLKSTAYYVVNDGGVALAPGTWCRSHSPIASTSVVGGGTATQKQTGNSPVSLSITGVAAGGYADNGFYAPLGTLGSLVGYSVTSSGSAVGTNLYFGTTSGDFFAWTGNCLSGYGNTSYGLGPTGTGTVTVSGSSTFDMYCNGVYASYSLATLQTTGCALEGITSTTPVAVWIGITALGGGSLSTKITSAQVTTTP